MKCPNCGANLREGAQFCPKCGTKLEGPVKGSAVKPQYIITGAVILAIAGIGIGTYLFNSKDDGKEEVAVTDQEQTEVTTDANTEEKTEEIIATDDVDTKEELLSNFGLSESNIADYASEQVRDYTQYKHYDSGIGNFKFGYPAVLYNDVNVFNELEGGTYGTILHQVNMSGTDGSCASFTIYKNEIDAEDKSMEGMTSYVFDTEKESLFTPSVQINGVSNDGLHGTIIMTAYADEEPDSDCIYDLCRVENDYVYQMKFSYPRPLSEEEDKNKTYFSDTMYRLCGFSGTSRTTPDTYEAFVDRRYTNFTLTDWQKGVFWGVIDGMVKNKIYAEANGENYEMPLGDVDEMARLLSNDKWILQMLACPPTYVEPEEELFAYIPYDANSDGKRTIYKDEVGEEAFSQSLEYACGEKNILWGELDNARTFYRDMFNLELNTSNVLQDSKDFDPGDSFYLLYNKDYNELVNAYGYAGSEVADGPDDWDYNEELDCFDYHMGPVYMVAAETWQELRDAEDPGNGIYVAHIRPYNNNSLGFKLLGIERVE